MKVHYGALLQPNCITYDLVSLLRDCYVTWPQTFIDDCLSRFYHKAIDNKLMDAHVSERQFKRWFDWMGIQRHLKVIGIFSRLHWRDNKSNYLSHLPRIRRYLLDVSQQYQELDGLTQILYTLQNDD